MFQVVEAVTFQRVVLYEACIERWPSSRARLFYAVCLLLLQSVIPALVVATVHARIASYLHAHATTQRDSRRARKELERNRRTTLLLTGIAVLFAVSWLPLGGGTEEATTRTQLNHFSVAPLNNGPALPPTAPGESVALLTTNSTQEALKIRETGEVSIL
ncbi:hypothetical protein C0J52_16798 [Blattella germanica]|nr:hypothetical protein C0J52_16798 [Blattella germanica]